MKKSLLIFAAMCAVIYGCLFTRELSRENYKLREQNKFLKEKKDEYYELSSQIYKNAMIVYEKYIQLENEYLAYIEITKGEL